jgi:acid phosphatase family membrane protein YuiD
MLSKFFENPVLITALIAWFVAQFIKPFVEFMRSRTWNWGFWFSSGGMPSSHSSTIIAAMLGIGLFEGFNTSLFALAAALAMIVIYDAAGVRRQAGIHAQKINEMINLLLQGHPISEKELKEVIGHSPIEVVGGVILGGLIAVLVWIVW